MAKNPTKALPNPKDLTAVAQNIDPDKVNKIALRRGKIRELMRMGYEPHQISIILDKGIKVGKGQTVRVPISELTIRHDMEYIRQEDASVDIDFAEKRAEIIDKLQFLYNRAIREYTNAKGATRNSFMNTALTVLSKIVEIEGIKSPEKLNVNLGAEARITKFAAEVHKLSKDDQIIIINTIRKVLKKRQPGRVGSIRVSGKSPRIPTPASNNEGVSRKS